MPLREQELRNAIYSGPFVTVAKAVFRNSLTSSVQKWGHYIKGEVRRQDYLERALEWISATRGLTIDGYMSLHRRGGSTSQDNCQMLCRAHNRAKGNK